VPPLQVWPKPQSALVAQPPLPFTSAVADTWKSL
jgi:hypothetical protein